MCGFSSAITFKAIDSDDIAYVENFVKNELFLCDSFVSHVQINDSIAKLSETNKIHFYGKYTSNPEHFQFSAVEKKMIEFLVAHVKQVVDSGGVNKQLCHFSKNEPTSATCDDAVQIGNYFCDLQIEPKQIRVPTEYSTRTHYFLNKLNAAANRNAFRDPSGYRYDNDIKQFATYFRILAGPFAYDTIQRNSQCALPAISSTNRYIRHTNCGIVEGILRCEELCVYLEERNLPFEVSLSEDATRIEGKVQYDSKTNQLVGFVLPIDSQTGMPIPYSYKARNDSEILHHFAYEEPAHFVNVIMAQPLSKVAPFCLLIFGTNSRYTAEDVSKRWSHIVDQLAKLNINVVSISSDSDPKYNSAMRKNSGLGLSLTISANSTGPINWFSCEKLQPPFYVQDTTHIGTKLRNFMLKTKSNPEKLPFGRYFIDIEHLENLQRKCSKSEHLLCATTLNPDDRQNFSSVLRMCDEKVSDLLRKYVKNSEATAFFLDIMRDVIAAYMQPNLTPLERIQKIWFSLFVIRIWRAYILSTKNLTLKNNFLTQYCYICIELNAHSLVLLLFHLKEKNKSEFFKPDLFSSQQCESLFRMVRSFTSTYSTVVNCSVKEILERINKIQLQGDIATHNAENFAFPRMTPSIITGNIKIEMPTQKEIYDQIEKCKARAVQYATKIGLMKKKDKNSIIACKVLPYVQQPSRKTLDNSRNNCFKDNGCLYEKLQISLLLKSGSYNNHAEKFRGVSVGETRSHVEMNNSAVNTNRKIIIKKTFLCWLLSTNSSKLSSDRLKRVKSKIRKQLKYKTHCEYARRLKC